MERSIDRARQWQHHRCARIVIASRAYKSVCNLNVRYRRATVNQSQSIRHVARYDTIALKTKASKRNTLRNSSDAEQKHRINIIYGWHPECNGVVVSSTEKRFFSRYLCNSFWLYSKCFTLLRQAAWSTRISTQKDIVCHAMRPIPAKFAFVLVAPNDAHRKSVHRWFGTAGPSYPTANVVRPAMIAVSIHYKRLRA